jgi:transcriptional regulator with XRE-family HTH domain
MTHERRKLEYRFSSDVIEYLMSRGMTVTQIAAVLKVSKSFISRVKSRQRSLTIDHLLAIEDVIGQPLPLLLLEAIPLDTVPPDVRPLYEETLKLFRANAAPPKPARKARPRASSRRLPATTRSVARRKAG